MHDQGSEVGKTQIEATSDSTNPNVEGKQRGGVSGKPRNNPTKAEREAKQQAKLKVIQDSNLEPTHHLTREEIANKPMHPEMKKIIKEGNKQIESDPLLKANIEKLKANIKFQKVLYLFQVWEVKMFISLIVMVLKNTVKQKKI